MIEIAINTAKPINTASNTKAVQKHPTLANSKIELDEH